MPFKIVAWKMSIASIVEHYREPHRKNKLFGLFSRLPFFTKDIKSLRYDTPKFRNHSSNSSILENLSEPTILTPDPNIYPMQ